jgi:hypothetical protein
MTIQHMKAYLKFHQVPEELYVIQELGEGEVDGIGFIDGAWTTYYSERGQYRNRRTYETEEEAVAAFLVTMRELMKSLYGLQLP